MDDLTLIAEVLCRLNLPDREVYPALALLRDQPSHDTRQNLQKIFDACVRRGLDLPDETNIWKALVDHPHFRKPDTYRESLLQRAGQFPGPENQTSLFKLLSRATALLELNDAELTEQLSRLSSANVEQVERLLLPAFLKAALAKLKTPDALKTWLTLHQLKELQKETQILELCMFLAGREIGKIADTQGSPLLRARLLAYQIAGLLGDDPAPPNLGGEGGGGAGVPIRPIGPRPAQGHQKKPPTD